jgi:hypothetical protein
MWTYNVYLHVKLALKIFWACSLNHNKPFTHALNHIMIAIGYYIYCRSFPYTRKWRTRLLLLFILKQERDNLSVFLSGKVPLLRLSTYSGCGVTEKLCRCKGQLSTHMVQLSINAQQCLRAPYRTWCTTDLYSLSRCINKRIPSQLKTSAQNVMKFVYIKIKD